MRLSQDDVQQIATAVSNRLQDEGFHIDPQQHYNQHIELEQWIILVNNARNGFVKAVLSMLIVGGLAVLAVGVKFTIAK